MNGQVMRVGVPSMEQHGALNVTTVAVVRVVRAKPFAAKFAANIFFVRKDGAGYASYHPNLPL